MPQAWLALLTMLLVLSLLTGCAATPKQQSRDVATTIAIQQPPTVEPFDSDTLYSLLVAEMAAYDHLFDITLSNYLEQTRRNLDPGLAERTYDIASALNQREIAAEASKLWLENDPENNEALKARSLEMLLSGNINMAMPGLIAARAKTAEIPFQLVAMQAEGMTKKEREKLLTQFRMMMRRWPSDYSLQYGFVMLLKQQGRYQQALQQLDKMAKSKSEDHGALRLKAEILFAMGRTEQALALLKEGVGDDPGDLRLRLLYARLLVKSGDLISAQLQFEVLMAQQPNNPDLLISVGLIALENGMAEQAGVYFRRLHSFVEHEDLANFYLGRVAQQVGDWREGLRYFQAVKPGPQFAPAHAAMARMLADHAMIEMARQELARGRAFHPSYAPLLYLIEAEVLLEQRSYDDAVMVLDRSLARFPEHVGLLYSRAMLAERLGDLPLLENCLRRILVLEPDNVVSLNALGYTLADRTDRLIEAQNLIYQAYQLDPTDPSILDSMGWVEYRRGNPRKALVWLRKAYAKAEDAEVAAHLGEVLWVLGQRDEARTILDKAQQKEPDNEVLQSTLERLHSLGKKPYTVHTSKE